MRLSCDLVLDDVGRLWIDVGEESYAVSSEHMVDYLTFIMRDQIEE